MHRLKMQSIKGLHSASLKIELINYFLDIFMEFAILANAVS